MPHQSLTILIVNWRTPELLSKCLNSLALDENYLNWEIYVVDNNSQDESVNIIESQFKGVNLIKNTANLGFSIACNQVFKIFTTNYIFLLNPDTTITKNAISTLVNYMQANPDVGICGPKVLNQDGSLQLACRRSFPTPLASLYRLTYLSYLFPKHKSLANYNLTYADENTICEVDSVSGAAMLIRKNVLEKIGFFDENIFMFGEDLDLCWRAKSAGFKVVYLPQSVIYHIHGAASQKRPIGTTINLHMGMYVFYQKHLSKKYPHILNFLVYFAIIIRAVLFIIINLIRSFFPIKSKNLVKS